MKKFFIFMVAACFVLSLAGGAMAVGKGKILDNGAVQTPEVKVGDKILYGKYSGNEITTKEGEELLIMREEDILAIIK